MDKAKRVYQALDDLKIKYTVFEHEAVYTIDEAKEKAPILEGAQCKNLFLRNKKGTNHYLIICLESTIVDLKKLTENLNEDRLSFASPKRLVKYLGVEAGSVSPFNIINDPKREVMVIIDKQLKDYEKASFHPNLNIVTLTIKYQDLITFLSHYTSNLKHLDL